MSKNIFGLGVISCLENNRVTRRVVNCNTNVNLGSQLIIKKSNLNLNGATALPQITVDNLTTYSVSSFAVGGDDTATDTAQTSLNSMFAIRLDDDDNSDAEAGANYLKGTYDIDHSYDTEDGGTVVLFPTEKLDASTDKDNYANYKDHYYWKQCTEVKYVAPNAAKYKLTLNDKDVRDKTLANPDDTSLTIKEFAIFSTQFDTANNVAVDNTDSDNYAKVMLARLTDSYIKNQTSSIIIEWTVSIV